MQNEFCPDCGHMLTGSQISCQFCEGPDHATYFGTRDFDSELEDDSVFWLAEGAGKDEQI